MKTLKFKTNINCNGCIAKVTPSLNELKGVKWSVDTTNPLKILTVETDEMTEGEIIQTINQTGYKAEVLG